jgi:hypothetical protein
MSGDWFAARKKPVEVAVRGPYDDPAVVETLEGDFEVDEEYAEGGFYIIRGVEGEVYPCRKDIFEATYDRDPLKPLSTEEDNKRVMCINCHSADPCGEMEAVVDVEGTAEVDGEDVPHEIKRHYCCSQECIEEFALGVVGGR